MKQGTQTLKERMLNILRECSSILSEYDVSMLSNEIDLAQKRLMQPMQLAIIGIISSSKST